MRSAMRSSITPKPKKRPAPVAAGVKWDATKKHFAAILSNNDLKVTKLTTTGLTPRVRATMPHSTGKRAIRFFGVFQASPDFEELEVGLVTAVWDWADTGSLFNFGDGTGFGILWDGYTYVVDTWVQLPISAVSGEAMIALVDFDAGKIWFANAAGPSGNPEAGTGQALNFTPNTPLYPGAHLSINSGANVESSIVIDGTYSSGTFAAWNA